MDEDRNFAKSVPEHLSRFALTIPSVLQSAADSALVSRRKEPHSRLSMSDVGRP